MNRNDIIKELTYDDIGHQGTYTDYTIEKCNFNKLVDFLTEEVNKGNLELDNIAGSIKKEAQTAEETSLFICIHRDVLEYTDRLSEQFPNGLVIGELGWDYDCAEIYKAGKKAEKHRDYRMEFSYEPYNMSFNDPEIDYCEEWDTDFTVYNTNNEVVAYGGAGCISTEDRDSLMALATTVKEGIDRNV